MVLLLSLNFMHTVDPQLRLEGGVVGNCTPSASCHD